MEGARRDEPSQSLALHPEEEPEFFLKRLKPVACLYFARIIVFSSLRMFLRGLSLSGIEEDVANGIG